MGRKGSRPKHLRPKCRAQNSPPQPARTGFPVESTRGFADAFGAPASSMRFPAPPRRFAGLLLGVALATIVPGAASTAAYTAAPTDADYARALEVGRRISGKVFRDRVAARWLPDGNAFWYRIEIAPGRSEHVFVDLTRGERSGGLEAATLAARLTAYLGTPVDPERLPGAPSLPGEGSPPTGETEVVFHNDAAVPLTLYWLPAGGEPRRRYRTLAPGERHTQHTIFGHRWLAETDGGVSYGTFTVRTAQQAIRLRAPAADPETNTARNAAAPDRSGRPWRAFIRDHNVWLRDHATGTEHALSTDGSAQNAYREPFHWSPDHSRLVVLRTEPAQERKIHLIESSPADQVQPKLHTVDYLKPGDRIAHPRPRLFDVARRAAIPIDDALFPEPWSITQFHWLPDSSQFAFLYNERGHQLLRLVAIDATDGAARPLLEERSATFIDYSQKTLLRWLDRTGDFLWASERDGWNHLYRHDARTGALKNRVTAGAWVVRGLEYLDERSQTLWLRVLGHRPGEDPYHTHLARVHLDGSGFTRLTEGDGTHRFEWSPDRRHVIATWSRVDHPPVTEVRRADDGKLICELERADVSALLATGWRPPERFVAPGRDGRTAIHGLIVTPPGFEPARSYPVLEHIYAGPHDFFVPKAWGVHANLRAFAELGFVVVKIDGMGTNWRSRAFHDVAWRNLKDAGLPDRIAWLRAAAATRPWLDLTRVGIFGGSAGGQNALAALLHHGDFYRAAAADCGCHDNRMDKIWWNEAWLGRLGPHYAENSNVTHAAKLRGKLLLTVGELDRNVDPASTLQVAHALIKAGKDFDLLVVPGAGHGAGELPYPARRRMEFFVRHLLAAPPTAENAASARSR